MTLTAIAMASTAIVAAPASATVDNAGYVGIEAGLWFPSDIDVDVDSDNSFVASYEYDLDLDMGFDGDIIAGYDFGQFRLEGELAYKTADIDEISVSSDCCDYEVDDVDADISIWSLMGNVLWNPTLSDRWDAYLGGGIGWAWGKFEADNGNCSGCFDSVKDNAFAWQLIAGIGYQISDNVELGLKYRYFQTKFSDETEVDFTDDAEVDTKVRSHSLLASLIFSFGSAPPPPPPPATQTCPDGSVILATDACPPPPPPPPPPPEPERG